MEVPDEAADRLIATVGEMRTFANEHRRDALAALRVHGLRVLGALAERVQERHWDVVCGTSKTLRTLASVADALPATPSPSRSFGFAGVDGRTAPVLTAEMVNVVAAYLAR